MREGVGEGEAAPGGLCQWLSQLWCLSNAPLVQVGLGQQGYPWPSSSS